MWPGIRRRARVYQKVIWHGGKALVALLGGEVVAFILVIKGEVLPESWQKALRLSNLPSLSFWQWATVAIGLLTLFILEGAYRMQQGSRAKPGLAGQQTI